MSLYIVLYSVLRQMVRLPESIQKHISRQRGQTSIAGLALTLSLVFAGCATAPDTVTVDPEETPAAEVDPSAAEDQTPDKVQPEAKPDGAGIDKQPGAADEMVTVSVYTVDDQCNDFVEQSVQVPSDQAIASAVGKAMGAVEYNAFKLSGYQVDINGSIATVDMQLAPGSQRQFVSLSSCEQRALFGSVEETLLNNSDWDVETVKFTASGKELTL
ncbi:sporulation/spore germination protein [cf. Phormidesmis sp. LEGE 11477]|uniref:sporulation/spore germination protein n=1 Tax=cf. Phormidesmis sp. LEGE 11477 TaxID=1828680 RepID=UPI00187EE8E9|nr:sporulation/spore germination protein [cf. Phormidesmis sp. LEGE 11477]MBE9061296.1 sporulation/spore germination protein [cf. Phormidesmis sp. LEGE 11477]